MRILGNCVVASVFLACHGLNITLIDKNRGKPYNRVYKRDMFEVGRTIHGRKHHYFDDCAGGG